MKVDFVIILATFYAISLEAHYGIIQNSYKGSTTIICPPVPSFRIENKNIGEGKEAISPGCKRSISGKESKYF